VASQIQMGNLQASMRAGMPVEPGDNGANSACTKVEVPGASPAPAADSTGETTTPEVFAHSLEFVALPGETEKLRREIPVAMRNADRKSEGFSGSIVLFSEQEARLVTVITLWTGSDRAKQCNENSKRLKRLLEPYVDRWLRTRRFVTFLSVPEHFPARKRRLEKPVDEPNSGWGQGKALWKR